ncbi:MAG: alpha/beta hydrolase [Deltaproteobacteria bacterium]|nr:alpha/beta hydrolase [Deltaproteobacteria bacterium]MBT4267514.1 alpha/beta hydrolase [Deltaproteobacteria bacterium]MBT4642357.1 alpha/beta hydrolase [Deltaproteobacteria bacterium]MBT6502167.1 alpha/beta hydrolase [Deltaproteobacteria bacterium]MBT7713309.1 alpha/beta hydrolase [Deltaproteobacteria bacterium]
MKTVKGDGIDINLAIWEGQGKDILCVHGITANCRSWDMVASSLAPDFNVMAMDLRGRGMSDKPDSGYSLAYHIRDIVALLDDLDVERVILMGHSLGAFISLAFAAEHPDRVDQLILVDGAGDLSPEQLDQVFVGIKPALDRLEQIYPSKEAYLEAMKSGPAIQPWNSVVENYYKHEIEITDSGAKTNISPENIVEEAGNVRTVKCRTFYPQLKCRTLILKATEGLLSREDLLLPEDVTAIMMKEIPAATRFDVEGTNHYGILFQPHATRDRAIVQFLIG